jgi:hypothetical protein
MPVRRAMMLGEEKGHIKTLSILAEIKFDTRNDRGADAQLDSRVVT